MGDVKVFQRPAYRKDAHRLRQGGDLRDAHWIECGACNHGWWAPVPGKCPRCGSADRTKIMLSKMLDYVRA